MNVIKWILSICCLIAGTRSLPTSSIQGLVYLMVGLFLMPPILGYLENDLGIKIPRPLKYVIVILGFLLASVLQKGSPYEKKELKKEREEVVDNKHTTKGKNKTDLKSGSNDYVYDKDGNLISSPKKTESKHEKKVDDDPNCLKYVIVQATYGTITKDGLDKVNWVCSDQRITFNSKDVKQRRGILFAGRDNCLRF